jgi:hypothetical protein
LTRDSTPFVHQSTKKAASEKRPFVVQRIKFPLELNETQAAVLLTAISHEANAEETEDHHGPGR